MPPAGGRDERFALLVEGSLPAMLMTFARRVREAYGFTADERGFYEQAMDTASDVIGDVVRSVRVAEVTIDDRHVPGAWAITQAGREECISPSDGLAVAVLLLNTVLAALTGCVAPDHELMPCFAVAAAALNESVSRRMQAVSGACAAVALDRVHRAKMEERRRIARELHDRVGEPLTVGLRRLDLLEIAGRAEPPGQAAVARETVVEAMRRLRVVTCDLREPPVASLEKALLGHLETVRPDAEVRLQISGDEAWVPPAVLDEVFLIVREALRNALTHGAPQLVLIGVELSPDALSAWVIDDGCGFWPAQVTGQAAVGTGLTSMRERAGLLAGRARVSSMPGHGTRVEIWVPLPGQELVSGDASAR